MDIKNDYYNKRYAKKFEQWCQYYDGQTEVEMLLDNGEFQGKNVLEVGCGSGRLSFRIQDEECNLISIDKNPSLIDLCHDKVGNRENIRFEVQNALNLPYPDDYFDLIIDGWTFSEVSDFNKCAEEYKRVLKDGGSLFLITFRKGSKYQDMIDFILDGNYYRNLPDIEAILYDCFGEPEYTKNILSEYTFSSVREAFSTFRFIFNEWMGIELSESQRYYLRSEIESHKTDTGICIGEKSKFYKYNF